MSLSHGVKETTNMMQLHRGVYSKGYYSRYEAQAPEIEPYLREIFRDLIEQASNNGLKLSALDVGCGIGTNVRFLTELGLDVLGIDVSDYAAKSSKQVQATGILIPIRSDSVDLITAIHFVEHLTAQDLAKFLAECRRVLKGNGFLFLITPNGISPVRFFLRKRFFFDITHVFFSNPFSLEVLLKESGFEGRHLRFGIRLSFRRDRILKDIILFLLTSTYLAYFRNVLHVAARK
jgi:SAM-dependent methyltransferase